MSKKKDSPYKGATARSTDIIRRIKMSEDSLAYKKWNCKYHIVFAPKYRRQIIYGKLRVEIGKILRDLCTRKGVEIIEAECCPDHIHMLCFHTTEAQRLIFHGVSEGQEQPDHIRQVRKPQVPLRKQAVLVPWLLRRHGWEKQGGNRKAHSEPASGGQNALELEMKELFDPFTGEPTRKK